MHWDQLPHKGFMRNYQIGVKELPIYHGHSDLRISDIDLTKDILLAAPSTNPQGQRIVGFVDGRVSIIDEADYQKRIAAKVRSGTTDKNATLKITVTANGTWFNGRQLSAAELTDELNKWPEETPIEIIADPMVKYEKVMPNLDICRKAGKTQISFRSRELSQNLFGCRLVDGRYTMEHPKNAGSAVLLSERHVANAAPLGKEEDQAVVITLNDVGRQQMQQFDNPIRFLHSDITHKEDTRCRQP